MGPNVNGSQDYLSKSGLSLSATKSFWSLMRPEPLSAELLDASSVDMIQALNTESFISSPPAKLRQREKYCDWRVVRLIYSFFGRLLVRNVNTIFIFSYVAAGTICRYLKQCRQEIGARLIQQCYKNDEPCKFWLAFASRRFLNKSF